MSTPATAAVRLLTGEREPVRLATTANITLYGLQTIDGVLTEVGDRVLAKDMTDGTQNGIYTASEGTWYRASDARSSREMQKGTTVHTQLGTVNADRVFQFTAVEPVIGTDVLTIVSYLPPDIADAAAAAAAAELASEINAGLTAADRAATAISAAAAAAAAASATIAANAAGYFPLTAATNVPRGIMSVGAITLGATGTNGTFALAWTGGNFSINPTGTFTVAGGVLTAVSITGPGEYVGASPTAPTPSFAASAGLAGAAVVLNTDFRATSGQGYWALSADGFYNQLYKNNSGSPAIVTGVTSPTALGMAQEGSFTKATVLGLAAAAVAVSTGWSAAIFVCPQTPATVDGYLTSLTLYGTTAGQVRVDVLTKSGSNFTKTATAEFDVAAGKVTVAPNLAILTGQYICWRHTGTQHYDGNPSGSTVVSYFNTEPSSGSAETSHITAQLQFSATVEPQLRGIETALNARVATLEGGTIAAVLGKAAGSVGAATAWSGTIFLSPQEPSLYDGYWTSLKVHGTNVGQLTCQVVTRNADGTYTATAEKSFDVAAGDVTVVPDLAIAKGQYLCWQHTGIQHYTNPSGNVIVSYFNTKPATNSAKTSQVTAVLEYSATIEGSPRGLAAALGRRTTALEGISATYTIGKTPGSLVAGTAFSNLVWVSPQEPFQVDGYLINLELYGTSAGAVYLAILTRNADGTFTTTTSATYSVAAGAVVIHPDIFVSKGQYVCWRHTGSPNYSAGGNVTLDYFNTQPTTSTARTSFIIGALEYSATVQGTYRGLETITGRAISAGGSGTDWVGLNGDCIGTSLTAGDDWVGLVKTGLGLATLADHGAGGGMITQWDPGTGVIGGQIMSAIASINAASKIVLMEGMVNDWWNGAPLGVYTDRVQGTFYGALRAAYAAIHAQAPNALVVVMASWNTSSNVPPYTQESEDTNSVGLSPWHYQEAMRISAMMNGWPFVPLYMLRGFWTPNEYADHIHPPASGNQQVRTARFILNAIRGITPLT